MNIPIAAVTAAMVALFLDDRVPRLSLREKLLSLDWA